MRHKIAGFLSARLAMLGSYGAQFFLYPNFQWKQYIRMYPDLEQNGINTKGKAIRHWLVFGKKEGRVCAGSIPGMTTVNIMAANGIHGGGLILLVRPKSSPWEIVVIHKDPSRDQVHMYLRKIKKRSRNVAPQSKSHELSFSADSSLMRAIIQMRGKLDKRYKDMIVRGKPVAKLLPDPKLYMLAASIAFEAAETELSTLAYAMDYVLRWVMAAYEFDPTSGYAVQLIDVILSRFSNIIIHKTAALGLLENPVAAQILRGKMLDLLSRLVQLKNELFQKNLGQRGGVTPMRPRFGKILIVGTPYIPQSYYYRAKQKAEHFKKLGLKTDYLEQAELGGLQWQSRLIDVDLVVVCRLPATFEVLRFIYYAKGLGIPVLYDIDDLIFDGAHFPAPLTSYAELIDQRTHVHLMLDVPLFRAVLLCCDGIIVSTAPLARQVQQCVAEKTPVWVYPNLIGEELASLGVKTDGKLSFADFQEKPFRKDGRLRIFYGSGTKAHKEAFYDILVPAFAMILEKYEQVEVQMIGHFKLPKILERFSDRILMVPFMDDYGEYLEHLKRADINVAILEKTILTDCKSEIKWLEAAAFGIPSVLTPTELYGSLLGDGWEALFASSIADWVKALGQLIDNASLRERIGFRACARALSDHGAEIGEICAAEILQHYLPPVSPNQRKRILVVNTYFAPQSIGGATRIAESQVSYLAEKYGSEYEIHVLCADCSGFRAPYEVEQYVFGDVLVTKLYVPDKPWQEHSDPKVLAFCRDFYLKYNFDLIHFHCLQILTASVVDGAQALRIPYVVTVHDGWWLSSHQFLVDEDGKTVDPFNPRAKPEEMNRRDSLKRCLRQARAVLAVSETFAKIYRASGLTNVIVNENGVEPFEILPKVSSPHGKVRVAHVGGIPPHKGFSLFREALKKGVFERIEAIVVDHALELGEELRETWGKTQVRIIPRVKQEEINRVYSEIDVLVAPSTWPESYGLVTREAKMAGVWVIASDRGAIGADVHEGIDGNVISVDDHQDLMKVFGQINKNKDFYLNFRGVKTGKRLRLPSDQAEELAGIYKNLFEAGKTQQSKVVDSHFNQ